MANSDFFDHVVVTSSGTAVDTDALSVYATAVKALEDAIEAATMHVLWAKDELPILAPELVEEVISREAIDQVLNTIAIVRDACERHRDRVVWALLIYLSAEGKAQDFERVWRQFGYGFLNPWNTGPDSIHGTHGLGRIGGSLAHRPNNAVDNWVLGSRTWFDSAFITWALHVGEFRNGTGDGMVGVRAQFDVAATSRNILSNTLVFSKPTGGALTPGTAQWWARNAADTNTNNGQLDPWTPDWNASDQAQAAAGAALLTSWLAGINSLKGTSSYGVWVSTGRGEDGQAAQGSWVRPAQNDAPRGITYVPGTGAIFPLLSAAAAKAPVSANVGTLGSAEVARAMNGRMPPGRAPIITATPRAPSELIGRVSQLGQSKQPQIEILEHRGPTGTKSWSVVVYGTQEWSLGSANPQDTLTNGQAAAGFDSDQSAAILESMKMAGIGRGEPVEFVGHSQGGMVVGQLASDPQVLQRYQVVSVLTAGAPTAGAQPGQGVRMLALENTRDLVPAVDGAGSRLGAGSASVLFDGGTVTGGGTGPSAPNAHDIGVYQGAMKHLEEGIATGQTPSEVQQWVAHRDQVMGLGGDTVTTSHLFDTRRILPDDLAGASGSGQSDSGRSDSQSVTHPDQYRELRQQ